MMNDGNITLTIGSGSQAGISYAIDAKLDAELATDVKLDLKAWNSVFAIVKADNATEEKQYTGRDSDITNGNHYQVKAGQQYQITKNAWAQIVAIAKEKMGIVTPENEATEKAEKVKQVETTTTTETEDNNKAKNAKDDVKAILQNAEIQASDEDIDDITDKYNAIIQYAKSQNKETTTEEFRADLAERITNYAKGLQYHSKEKEFAKAVETETPTNTTFVNKDIEKVLDQPEKYIEAYKQFGNEYVELYDDEKGDGSIDTEELITMEEKELGRKLTEEEKTLTKELAEKRIKFLDRNNNDKIDRNEAAAYLWAMSKIVDTKDQKTSHEIKQMEWEIANSGIGGYDENSRKLFEEMYNIGYEALK